MSPRPSPLMRFLAYAVPYRRHIVGAALAGVVKFVVPLGLPLLLKYVTDVVLGQHPGAISEPTNRWLTSWCGLWERLIPRVGSGPRADLTVLGVSSLAASVLLAVASYYRSAWAGYARNRMIFDLRCALFAHVQSLSHSFFQQRRSGAIVSRFTSDLQQAQNFVGSALTNVWMDGAALAVVIWILFTLQPTLAIVALLVVPAYIGLIRYFSPRLKATSQDLQERIEDFSGDLQERIAGVAVVKAFGREGDEARRFHSRTESLHDVAQRNTTLSAAQQAWTTWLTNAAPLVVIWVGGVMIAEGRLSVGSMIAVYAYLGSLYLPLQRFSELSVVTANSLAAMERIFELFDTRPEVDEVAAPALLPAASGRVVFESVRFRYPPAAGNGGDGSPLVLDGIDLVVEPGEAIAVVGRSGAGKSTLVSLIPRFYDPTDGRVCIDGHDVRELRLASLRGQIGIVLQDPILFSGTIAENLLYGRPDASETQLLAAVRAADADELLARLPQGLLTVVGERGLTLSSGQRQRLAIARAFLRDPRILILDEATASLDSEAENIIHRVVLPGESDAGMEDAVGRLIRGRTTFVIAHRLVAALRADRIVVLDRGRIVENGPHARLIAAGGLYADLWREQTAQQQSVAIAERDALLHP